ncbi:LuxR family transcriptional regulator (plasmid) [Erwinia rhapontici]|uniref:helix-turn-helix transcriptional regulator n=1 Tax=Erwinia rhapontici TaxID=55212 RepID=UPI001BB309F5|nr:LuxR family transcriptional regulator [Erwinia rhapontici]BCQ42418.1 LuxR family transcriptional regulator [Erwinia rhapontici]
MLSIFDKNQRLTATLQDYIDRKLCLPGSPEYAYTVVSKKNPSEILIISSYPDEWIELYRSNSFQLTDPVVLTAYKRSSPFAWDENITLMSDLKFTKIFSLSRQYNIANGFTFVLHDHFNNLALLSIIIGNHAQEGLEERLHSRRGEMQSLLIDINEQMYLLGSSVAPDRQTGHTRYARALFTPRENQVLYWASMGKTYAEVAGIVHISVSTVKFHMGNAVDKLGVSNARQAIRLGVELGLITPESTMAR